MKLTEVRRLREITEDALRHGGVLELSDREIARLLGATAWIVGRSRRRLEAAGQVPVVDCRLGRHGGWMRIARIGEARRRATRSGAGTAVFARKRG